MKPTTGCRVRGYKAGQNTILEVSTTPSREREEGSDVFQTLQRTVKFQN